MAQITVISVSLIALSRSSALYAIYYIGHQTSIVYTMHANDGCMRCTLELKWILFWGTSNRTSSANTNHMPFVRNYNKFAAFIWCRLNGNITPQSRKCSYVCVWCANKIGQHCSRQIENGGWVFQCGRIDTIGHFTGQTTLHKCIAHSRAGEAWNLRSSINWMCQSVEFSVSHTELDQRKQRALRAGRFKFAIGKTLDTSQRLSSTMFLPHLAIAKQLSC